MSTLKRLTANVIQTHRRQSRMRRDIAFSKWRKQGAEPVSSCEKSSFGQPFVVFFPVEPNVAEIRLVSEAALLYNRTNNKKVRGVKFLQEQFFIIDRKTKRL